MPPRGSRKVVLVLDHGSRFAVESNASVPVSVKQGGGVYHQIGSAAKTLWTWSVESVLEYHRIVSDLYFDSDRLLRVAVVDAVGRMLEPSWGEELITYQMVTKALSKVGAPKNTGEDSIPIAGILLAVEALSQRTNKQKEDTDSDPRKIGRPAQKFVGCTGDDAIKSRHQSLETNDGCIVVFCSLKNVKELVDLQRSVEEQIKMRNSSLANIGDSSPIHIDHVDLYVVNTYPVGETSEIISSPRQEIFPNLSCTVVSQPAGEKLLSAAHSVCLSIYDLVSTTVSGIPMKEEAQQGQSTNYDVELLHPRESHAILETLKLCGPDGYLKDDSRQAPYPTYKLSWSTPSPKNKWNLFPKTLAALRVTPAAVNSRPSVCLTSFLLGGRNVMLEVKRAGPAEKIPPNVNQKLISHTLIAHGGRIYIHAIDILPCATLEATAPKLQALTVCSDSEDDEDEKLEPKNFSTIKRVDCEESDDEYKEQKFGNTLRSADFSTLVKECFLRPRKQQETEMENVPCGQPIRHTRRLTRYWPMFKEDTLIFQFPERFTELINLYKKSTLLPAEFEDCKKAVYRLVAMKDDKTSSLCKGTTKCRLLPDAKNKEEQYKVSMIELASFMVNYANNSENHQEVLKLLVQALDLDRAVNISTQDVPIGNIDRIPEPRAIESISQSAPTTATSSRSSSPVPKKTRRTGVQWTPGERINVYEFLCALEERKMSIRPDFVGRAEAGNRPAHLYKCLDLSTAAPRGEVPL